MIEDEGRAVGSRAVPLTLFQGMQQYPLVWLEEPFENRVERILKDYVVDLCAEFIDVHGIEQGFGVFAAQLRQSSQALLSVWEANVTSACQR